MMLSSNKRKFTVTLFLVASVFISIAASNPYKRLTGNQGKFKNLQVLPKNISDDSLDMIMDNFKAALGVHCNFCHVAEGGKKDFASDDKPEKNIARHMMRMTMDINANYFNFDSSARPDTITVVMCKTCHRGNPHPDEMGMDNSDARNMPPMLFPPGDKKPDN